MGSHNPRNSWSPYFSWSAAETVLQDPHWPHPQSTTIPNISSVPAVTQKFDPHPLYLVTGALATAEAQLPCGFDSIQVQLSLFWWHPPHSATVAAVLSDTWLSAASELALPSWAGRRKFLGPFLNSFSQGQVLFGLPFDFWKIFCCAYLQSESSIAQLNSWLALSFVPVQQQKLSWLPVCSQEYTGNHWTNQILISPVRT